MFVSDNFICVSSKDGASIKVSKYGGQLLSWVNSLQEEMLYLSEKAIYSNGVAIRGGVPICFPQFGQLGALQQHGFLRTSVFDVVEQSSGLLKLRFVGNAETCAGYDYSFVFDLIIQFDNNNLKISVDVKNTSKQNLEFTCALHSYFSTNLPLTTLQGLNNLMYDDKIQNTTNKETASILEINTAIDRIYYGINNGVLVLNTGSKILHIHNESFEDVVIWNPFIEGNAKMKDLGDSDYTKFFCVESAQIKNKIVLSYNNSWIGSQNIRIIT
jgi:glucose-6-phosphate 1-epimerase